MNTTSKPNYKVKVGDEEQFIKAHDEYFKMVLRFCFFRTDSRNVAKDLTQDIFIRAWKYIQRGNDVDNMRALLFKIADNTVVDWYRKRKSQSLDTLLEAGFEPVDQEAAADKYSEMQTILSKANQLSAGDKNLILWYYIDGLTAEEIGKKLKQRKNTVSVKIHRAVGKLKKVLHQS